MRYYLVRSVWRGEFSVRKNGLGGRVGGGGYRNRGHCDTCSQQALELIMDNNSSRRDILRMASLASIGMAMAEAAQSPQQTASGSVAGMKFEAKDAVRLGFIGIGGRGNSLIDNFGAIPQVRITALCDVIQRKTEAAQAKLVKAGKPAPAL